MFLKWARQTYWPLVISAAGLVAVGSLFIYSASFHDAGQYEVKQFFWSAVACGVLFMVPFLGYRTFLSASYLFYALSLLLLGWVLIAGATRLGAQRWII